MYSCVVSTLALLLALANTLSYAHSLHSIYYYFNSSMCSNRACLCAGLLTVAVLRDCREERTDQTEDLKAESADLKSVVGKLREEVRK